MNRAVRPAGSVLAGVALLLGGCTGPIHHEGLFSRSTYVAPPDEPEPVAATKTVKPKPAPAVKRTYRYYPSVLVYADPGRSLYFYPENKKWKTGSEIPEKFGLADRKFVTLEIASEKPYLYNKAHRRKYPAPKVAVKKPAPAPVSATEPAASAAPTAAEPAPAAAPAATTAPVPAAAPGSAPEAAPAAAPAPAPATPPAATP